MSLRIIKMAPYVIVYQFRVVGMSKILVKTLFLKLFNLGISCISNERLIGEVKVLSKIVGGYFVPHITLYSDSPVI